MMLLNLILHLTAVVSDPSAVWPKPAEISAGNQVAPLSSQFKFTTLYGAPDGLKKMMDRYQKQMLASKWTPMVPTYEAKGIKAVWELKTVLVKVNSQEHSLSESTDESYSLTIKGSTGTIKAETIYGARHAMETLYQMVQSSNGQRVISKVPLTINDKPKFKHRGLLLDTSRNYYPVEDIMRTITTMGRNKMNVFHWHIVDSHSWPFQSKKHPKLSQKGAIFPEQIYTFEDIQEIVKFGMTHGVRVIPELEAPAHSYAIGLAYPEVSTCMDMDKWGDFAAEPPSGQIDPTNPKSIKIVKDLMDEFVELFPDSRLHLSGDEVNQKCWDEDENIQKYVKENDIDSKSLLDGFAKKMHDHAKEKKRSILVWEEMVLNHNVSLPKDTLVQIWNQAEKVKEIIEKGYGVVLSSVENWYLDCGRGGWIGNNPEGNSWCDPFKSWQRVYSLNLHKGLDSKQKEMVAGGEVALWSEQADSANLDILLWPRSSAAAEVLWTGTEVDSNQTVIIPQDALARLNNFRFHLLHHKVNAEPLQPLWCVRHPGRCNL
ncbi:Glucosamine-6-phosphate isomerase (Glucosamine-6-phosphate deaminase) (GNPDA) (GlcN6P deaminase) [Entomophthora muscae]|uniref:Glucosamine-6-phosphate isomerase (Glucosamine-6-phosphate deaminase) (GNPDA) (GlcN6P deaminase) n=1 Tax=Entomophthora muscae TaxID=34485 RepID=A0ACC2USP4_9FUNG|nr:Glucosamine-6-phosphate isomerase (Glucosamine-6-phosphate deaminase) (GNPDA) (GlcN6P deaminase) [Entomophthora muscae]